MDFTTDYRSLTTNIVYTLTNEYFFTQRWRKGNNEIHHYNTRTTRILDMVKLRINTNNKRLLCITRKHT